MADVLIYWRNYTAHWAYQFAGERAFFWHSMAKCFAELQPGDRMRMVTSGKGLREDMGFLVGVWAMPSYPYNPFRPHWRTSRRWHAEALFCPYPSSAGSKFWPHSGQRGSGRPRSG